MASRRLCKIIWTFPLSNHTKSKFSKRILVHQANRYCPTPHPTPKMNPNNPIYTCECCGNETPHPLTYDDTTDPPNPQWICRECVEETERLLEELRQGEREEEREVDLDPETDAEMD